MCVSPHIKMSVFDRGMLWRLITEEMVWPVCQLTSWGSLLWLGGTGTKGCVCQVEGSLLCCTGAPLPSAVCGPLIERGLEELINDVPTFSQRTGLGELSPLKWKWMSGPGWLHDHDSMYNLLGDWEELEVSGKQ